MWRMWLVMGGGGRGEVRKALRDADTAANVWTGDSLKARIPTASGIKVKKRSLGTSAPVLGSEMIVLANEMTSNHEVATHGKIMQAQEPAGKENEKSTTLSEVTKMLTPLPTIWEPRWNETKACASGVSQHRGIPNEKRGRDLQEDVSSLGELLRCLSDVVRRNFAVAVRVCEGGDVQTSRKLLRVRFTRLPTRTAGNCCGRETSHNVEASDTDTKSRSLAYWDDGSCYRVTACCR
ncbi:hypothetical protein QBC36DRAFT_371581 [Triangularia setosa]|uniref:Uncharacterized protein n=1 Tax=Triangularia setosa TaxID=2587417 RepID=A0AAN7A8Z1_9PEZI|nr:hypothetical protein QBC36DRAFT_371581 [Podospora setosa]